MNMQELTKLIRSINARNKTVKEDVQRAGIACLMQAAKTEDGGHQNTTPLNDLVQALTRSQVQAFAQWALAFGNVKRNAPEKMKAGQFFAFDATRSTDIEGATAKCWDDFAPAPAESVAKAFDIQGEVLKVMKKAAEAGKPQSMIEACCKAVGIDATKIPKSVAELKVLPEAIV